MKKYCILHKGALFFYTFSLVRIIHKKEEDVWWFYTTIFAVPLLILGIGILYNLFRRRAHAKRMLQAQ